MSDPKPLRRVLALVPDLMDRSRMTAVPGIDVRFVSAAGELASRSTAWSADVVVVDLARPGVLEALEAGGISGRIVGFGSHVDTDVLDAARRAGCHEVLPRSRFFGDPGRALAG